MTKYEDINGATAIRKHLQKQIEFSVTTATQEAAKMAIEQIKHTLKSFG